MRLNLFFICTALLFSSLPSFSQSDTKSEEELKVRANELFAANNFNEAKPLYAQLLSLYPKDLDYNFKYGTSVLLTEPDRDKALKYLGFAVSKSTVDPVAYFYHGLAYHLNYDFAKAVKIYSKFKTKAKGDLREKYQIDRQIEMAKNGNTLLSKLNEVQVIERQEIAEKDFYRIYKTDDLDGKMVSLPEEFKSKYDKKVGLQSVVFLPNNAKEVYFASYGKKPTAGKDIFKVIRLGNDTWSEPVNVGNSINTPYDEDYAFIHPDGRTLYFASKGHNSMGGYDIFRSIYDAQANEWGAPENLDFAFSSTSDDIMFVTNREGTIAYFASNRSTEYGKMTVFKTLTERKAPNLSVINGTFIVENSPEGQKAKITVIDQATKETVGMYETDAKGNYAIEITENGGDYQFNIETTEDAPIHTGIVSIPKQDEFEVLGQELRLVGSGEDQQLVIKNIFDGTTAENLKGSGPKVSAEVIRMKANLDVNYSASQLAEFLKESNTNERDETSTEDEEIVAETETESTEDETDEQSLLTEEMNPSVVNENESSAGANAMSSFTKETAVQDIEELQADLNQELDSKQNAINEQYSKANTYKEDAELLFEEAAKLETEDPESIDAIVKKKQAGIKALEAAYAIQIAQDIEESMNYDLTDLDKLETETEVLKQQLADGQDEEAKKTYVSLKSIEFSGRVKDIINDRLDDLDENRRIASKKLEDVNARTLSFQEEKKELSVVLENLNSEFETASKKRKTELQNNIDATTLDLQDLDYQYESMKKEVNNNRLSLKSLEVEEKQLNAAMSAVGAENTNDIVSEEEKNALVEQLKSYRDEDVIAYSSTNDLYADEIENTGLDNSFVEVNESTTERGVEASEGTNENSSSSDNKELEVNNEAFLAINQNFEEALNNSESILDEQAKLSKKVDVLNDWNTSLKSKKATQGSNLETEIDEQRRNELQEEIDEIQQQIVENNRSLKSFEARLSALKDGTAQPKPTEIASINEINDATIIDESFGNLKYKQQLKPTTRTSQQQLVIAKRSLYEAGVISKQEALTRESGYTLETAQERENAFLRANELKKEAEVKQIEAAELFARFNLQEFRANQTKIRGANNFKEGTNSTSLELANLLAEEAENFFTTAIEIRNGIEDSDRLTRKEVDFQKAYDYEILAIEKQKEAMNKLNLVSSEVLSGLIEQKTGIKTSAASNQAFAEATILDNEFAPGEGLLDPSNPIPEEENIAGVTDNELALETPNNELNIETPTVDNEEAVQQNERDLIDFKVIDAEPISVQEPKKANIYNVIEIDTVDIAEERKQLILETQTYVLFKQNREALAKQVNAVEVEYQEAKTLEEENERLRKQAIVETSNAENATDEEEKKRIIKSAQVITQSIVANEKTIDSLNQSIQERNTQIRELETNDGIFLSNLSEKEQREYVSLTQGIVPESDLETLSEEIAVDDASDLITNQDEIIQEETSRGPEVIEKLNSEESELPLNTEVIEEAVQDVTDELATNDANKVNETVENDNVEVVNEKEREDKEIIKPISRQPRQVENIDIIPRQVKEAIFITLSKTESAYNDAKPIPTKTEMPSGIVYKVQVGAFRNPIPQDLFKGFAPLMAEKTNSGITRYTAGLFSTETTALSARNSIRGIGYPDAFVVAFKDGKRVSVSALRAETGEEVNLDQANTTIQSNENSIDRNNNPVSTATSSTDNPTLIEGGSKENLGAEFTVSDVEDVVNTESVKGLFFTIQIGVFSKPVKRGTFNYEGLNVVKIADNLYRYNAGIFKSVIAAGDLKNTISSSIEDAFITAYYNGKRVSLEEASRLKSN